jgi:hypothetical protein
MRGGTVRQISSEMLVCGKMKTYSIREPGRNVWADWDFILEESLIGDIWGEFQDMTTQMTCWLINNISSISSVGYMFFHLDPHR